ncbi:malonate transporter subunit MadL [Sphingomonas sp. UYEF23]|uniref:malonate transporter subunit MadL n=1 Tax=Sphingomonas sp. UYEF23 TaxID=1756408 RepID=UPI00339667D9
MAIYGTALLALCTLLGAFLGEEFGIALHVKANVGGVGLAMLMLLFAKAWLVKRGGPTPSMRLGIEFWALLYIPIVVAMAAQQNVVAAVEGGPMVLLTGFAVIVVCFALVGLLGRVANRQHD